MFKALTLSFFRAKILTIEMKTIKYKAKLINFEIFFEVLAVFFKIAK